jgi:hypothetical protein
MILLDTHVLSEPLTSMPLPNLIECPDNQTPKLPTPA